MGTPAHFRASRREVPSSVLMSYCFDAPDTFVKFTLKETAASEAIPEILLEKERAGMARIELRTSCCMEKVLCFCFAFRFAPFFFWNPVYSYVNNSMLQQKWLLTLVGCGGIVGLHYALWALRRKKEKGSGNSVPSEGRKERVRGGKKVHFAPTEEIIDDCVCG